ncbi:MAG: FAD-dependent oxidoreductase [Burkholderiales bacterium]|nr:FAD-dependent oxidoreductase [Burkholderiales bacterium]
MGVRQQRIILVGGGHSHVEVLRRFALRRDPMVALTLVSPDPSTAYSGMLPGLVAGHYTREQAHIALAPLATWAGARFVIDRIVGVDLDARIAALASGERVAFDLLSIDVGSAPDTSVPGARVFTIPVKPVAAFLAQWAQMEARAADGTLRGIAIVGGGAGGVELALAMQHRFSATLGTAAPRLALITDSSSILPHHPAAVRRKLGRVLVARGVVLHLSSGAIAVEAGAVVVTLGRRVAADYIVWATGAAAPRWLAGTGLACDERGFVSVDDHLRSTSHAFVFAAGDCASQVGRPRPKSGVFAVRQGPPLAANLRRSAHGRPLRRFVPQRQALALISIGDRHALATRGPFTVEGAWVWRWKDWIDRRFMAKYVVPAALPLHAAASTPD